jgi:protease I
MKKVALIICFRDFKDEEFFICFEKLKKNKFIVKVVSDESGLAIGVDGGEIKIDFNINEISANQFDALIFIGGPGSLKRLNNEKSHDLIRESFNLKKIIGAICISSVILAESGILKDKEATVWSNSLDKSGVKILKENDVLYQDKSVVISDNIITANGPSSVVEFTESIILKLKEENK